MYKRQGNNLILFPRAENQGNCGYVTGKPVISKIQVKTGKKETWGIYWRGGILWIYRKVQKNIGII